MDSFLRFRINAPKVIYETIDGEAVIINLDTGCYYSLDKVGADIWGFIEKGVSVEEIKEDLVHRYDGSPTDIESAITRLIANLESENLILPISAKASGIENPSELPLDIGPVIEKIQFEAPTLQKYTDMQDLLLLDPIHEVDETGWPMSLKSSNENN